MFTGLISDVGTLIGRHGGAHRIRSAYPPAQIAIGASIACDGVCLTATSVTAEADGSEFTVDVSNETLSKSTLGDWQIGQRVNLERSLTLGDELGGHLVYGHIDGVARICDVQADGASRRFLIEAPEHLALYVAPKGSVALDGTSLTVNEVSGNRFGVNLIPHSLTVTTWGAKTAGQRLNIEVDIMARYAARILEYRR
jgi:riboflavin synthase